jgi:hypothetical protein
MLIRPFTRKPLVSGVVRLEKLGARKREKVRSWRVMISPGGHPFCVVAVQSKTWPNGSIEWNG